MKSMLPALNPVETAEPLHFSSTLGAMQYQRPPTGPMSTAVSSYPALPAPPPMFSLGTLARQLPSTDLPVKTAPAMPQMDTVGIMNRSFPPMALPPNNSLDRMQPPPPPAVQLDPSSTSLPAPKPGVTQQRMASTRQPARGDQTRSEQNPLGTFYRGPSGEDGQIPTTQNRIPTQPSRYPAAPQFPQAEPGFHPWYQQPMVPYWQQPYWQPPNPIQSSLAGVINPQQLAARHVVSRELPKFSGDPLEWPMFLSAFESTTSMCGIQPDENLARLQKCLVGKAREKVHSILTLPEAIPEIINTLRDECGRPDQLVHCLMSKIRNAPVPNVNKLDTLITFGREVRNLVTYIEAANLQAHLSNPMLLSELVGKLPPSIRLEWGLHTQRIPEVSLKAFSDFVSSIKAAACQVALPFESSSQDEVIRSSRKKEKSGHVNSHSAEVSNRDSVSSTKSQKQPQLCLMCQRSDHKIRNCNKFSSLSIPERWSVVDQRNLCQRCLTCHGKWPCRTAQPCGSNGCEEMHHKLLHPGKPKSVVSVSKGPSSSGVVTAHSSKQRSTLFKILPVTLSHNGKSVTTFAFLDDGSNVTLLENSIAEKLNLDGEESPLCLQWTSNVTRKESASRRVQVCISDRDGKYQHVLSQVQTVDNLGLPRQDLNYTELLGQFPHLRGLPIQSYTDAVPQILIGADNARLKLPLNKRERRDEEPVAIKTKLGWTIFGGQRDALDGNNRTMVHVCECSADQRLHDLVKDYFELEQLGITAVSAPESEEDERARRILQETTRRMDSGRFETGLLWKTDEINFPESYAMAERRLKCLERRLQADPELRRNVEAQIVEYQAQGYAHKASEEELRDSDPRRVWYLPLGIVRNPRKPGKVRIIWDAAARVKGVSLNSMLLSGPDLLTPLMSVLCQFRQRQFAITSDIRQMFHQLRIRKEDRQSQRFLWRTNPESMPDVYIMDVATFGATCSPCSAQYAKNLNAADHEAEYPEAARAITKNTYVDDYLDSRDTIDEAVQLAVSVREVHSKAGFELRNWHSNAQEILNRIGAENSPETVKSFTAEKTTATERILGMMWEPTEDLFVFSAQFHEDLLPLLSGEIVPTKRQVLRMVMSLFDPLGLISCFTVHGKILLQNIWRSGVGWDDPLIPRDFLDWQRWTKVLPELNRLQIPRCYFPDYERESYGSLQLHIFVDASELAYCGVAYFRIIDRGTPRCSLVAAKAKVTPLRPQSIPRNELNAGVIGVRLMKNVTENHSLQITKRYFHTDSTVLLAWLRADPRKYRPYVQFRTTEILADTKVEEWRWVPTRLNIADEATKWGNGPSFDVQDKWYRGPDFLWQPESEWPAKKPLIEEPTDELRKTNVHQEVTTDPVLELAKFSRWEDLIKSLAYLYHFVNRCSTKQRVPTKSRMATLTHQDFVSAEKGLWRMVQNQEFGEEISSLQSSESSTQKSTRLPKSSPLAKLSTFLDDDGILRSESRIDPKAAYYPYNFRNPIIVPKHHYVTDLLVLRFHRLYGHANTETVLNELRQVYCIPKMRSVVKKAVKKCMWCRVYRVKPEAPRMAPLPQPRVMPFVRPFTHTGIDYFGPLIVKQGRSNVKRWVAIFTCLTIRAVHLEVVHSLTLQSCKMAMRRFVDKRGAPQNIFSDNGTYFHGAARELAAEIKNINLALAGTFTNAETEWHFNPPSAPHMGGVWERKVRSIKDAFKVLAHREKLDDEGLLTLLSEASMIVNSRPLTFVPLESPEQEVLTPNSFLLMSTSGSSNLVRIPIDQPISLRTNWGVMLHLLNQFWKTWIKSYLPTIARRTKWFVDVRPLQVGDLVIIVDETVRNGWLRGKVTKTYPGIDGQVRKVDVQTETGMLQRPAIKVALLDVLQDGKTN
ncbi:uncharacterized protein LOC134290806 [Aedes albopictus]|uniref:Integrase catalytic domain-containing protein n=1 Tax=Aedes albopictus TaxID=7160 RepID=A0ABM1ZJU8_AEDAL